MRLVAISVLFGVAIPLVLLGIAWALDPAVPLSIPLAPGFAIQTLARRLGYVAPNRMLFWATPVGWSIIACAVLSLRAFGPRRAN